MKMAYFGTGLLGTSFVRRLLELGHEVRVWNRTIARATPLAADGARVFDDPAAAVDGVEQLHLTLADDASVDGVLEPLADAIGTDTWIVDHTTTSPTPTAARIARWAARGRRFVHVPVFMAPAAARQGTGAMLFSGTKEHYDALQPTLATMTGNVVYLGVEPGRAAAFKLFGNLLLISSMTLLGDLNRLAISLGISTADAMGLFQAFNPGPHVAARAARLGAGDFAATFESVMARKDLRLILEEAERHGAELRVVPVVAELLDEAIARGEGAADMVVVAKV